MRHRSLFSPSLLLFWLSLFLLLKNGAQAADPSSYEESLVIDLKDPFYQKGVLSTQKGGVIQRGVLRIQARNLQLKRPSQESPSSTSTIEGSGDVIVEYGDYIFVGEKIFYDFNANEGVIDEAVTAIGPWFFGGKKLELKSDKSCVIYEGYATTSENSRPDWGIYSQVVVIEKERNLRARCLSLKAFHFTLLTLPALQANLNAIFDNPIRYRFKWGGRQGPRVGLTYELFSRQNWKAFLRLDYRITRGPGGGIETYYRSEDRKTYFQTISYLAKDSSILHPSEKARYRFEGNFKKLLDEDKTSILMTYDKISDKDMPAVYYDRDFDFETAEKTQIKIRRQEESLISTLYLRARVNSFQTVKQELPTLEANFKPHEIAQSGIFLDNFLSASYLYFEYSKYLLHVHNYSSSRLQWTPSLFRPFIFGPYATLTPKVGLFNTLYGDTPKKEAAFLLQGRGDLELKSALYYQNSFFKHLVEPYAAYHYYTQPTSCASDHYIFDLSDGITKLHYLSFGINQSLYKKSILDESAHHLLSASLYSFAFFETKKVGQMIPRVYGSLSLYPCPTLKHSLDMGWNLLYDQMDYFNYRVEWSLSENLAIAAQLRHRGGFFWRKVDRENFFLDTFRSEKRLKKSALSDRCDTILLHLFYRFHPNWAVELTSRTGWNRRREPNYNEFEIDLMTTIQTAWNVRLSYQHQQNDDRIALFLNVGLKRPKISKPSEG